MKAVFISDAHIRDHTDPNLPPLLAFLERLRGQIETLWIVGDLFDTWFGCRRAVFEEYVPLLGVLEALKRSGARIGYVTGNHDFELGGFFERILQAEIHETEFVLEADGRRAFVAHGDMVNPGDRKYRLLRRILRARPARWLGRNLPPAWVWAIAQQMSESYTGEGPARRESLRTVFSDYAARKFQEGFDTVILGHLHVPAFQISQGPSGPRTYVNLGEWISARTFLRWNDGALALRRWTWPQGEEIPLESRSEPSAPPAVHGGSAGSF